MCQEVDGVVLGVLGGDWNVIRFLSERLGETQYTIDIKEFSNWIDSHSLIDL